MGGAAKKVYNSAARINPVSYADKAFGLSKKAGFDIQDPLNLFDAGGKTAVNKGAYSPTEATLLAIKEQQAALARSKQLAESSQANRQQALMQQGLAATGRGPSLAEAQLKSAQDRNLSQMLATATASRGTNPALAQRALMQAQSGAGRQLAQDAAEARLQERNQFLGNTLGVGAELQTGITGLGKLGENRDNSKIKLAEAKMLADESALERDNKLKGAIIGGVASVGGAMASDKNLKKDIKSANSDVSNFLNAISAKSYKYKNPEDLGEDSNTHFGIMAQDLEKSKIGKSMVNDTSAGKMVDVNKAVAALLASQAEIHQRMKSIEKKRG